jgi:hypothetical protein
LDSTLEYALVVASGGNNVGGTVKTSVFSLSETEPIQKIGKTTTRVMRINSTYVVGVA